MDAVESEGALCLHVAVIKQLHRESAFEITAGCRLGLCVISGLLVCFCSSRVFLFALRSNLALLSFLHDRPSIKIQATAVTLIQIVLRS